MKDSTAVPRDPRTKFHQNPVGSRVELPDGSLASVKSYRDTDQGRVYQVRGIHRDGRFRALSLPSCWFPGSDLRLIYYSASIRSDWPRS